jgi:hypothetical protein
MAVREFGANWYESGGHPTTALVTEQSISNDDATAAKERFREATRDDHIAVLGNGWELQSVQVSPDDALFLAATNATGVDICGYHGIHPTMLGYAPPAGGTITYQNGEQRMLDMLVTTLQWWFARVERCITGQIRPDRYVKINLDALLRSDAATRWKIHDMRLRHGSTTVNRVLNLEDEEGIGPDGDRYVWPPAGVPASAELSEADQAREIAEMIQKIYLGVGVVITAEEARLLINQAGGGLSGSADELAPPAQRSQRSERRTHDLEVEVPERRHETHIHLPESLQVEMRQEPIVIPAPIVNVPPAQVTVNVEPTPVTVNVEPTPVSVSVEPGAAPVVNVPAPVVTVLPDSKRDRRVSFKRDAVGQIVSAEVSD